MKTQKIGFSACCTLLIVGGFLEVLPRGLFAGDFQILIVSHLRETSSALQYSYELAEQLSPGYGPKFVLSQLILLLVFLFVSLLSIGKVWGLNTAVAGDSLHEAEFARERRLGACLILLAMVLLVQVYFIYFPLNPSGGSGSSMPILFRSLVWASIGSILIVMVVIWRRGSVNLAE